jgi:glycosyltransferase involved in cell wall biosynthesis
VSVPLVSVVTPSLDQGRFIERTIRSVLAQDHPRVEHVVVDGGSRDETLEILRRYPSVRWISEPDRGQSDALNKGFALARGSIVGWLNADDVYLEGAVRGAVAALAAAPHAAMAYANYLEIDEHDRELARLPVPSFDLESVLESGNPVCQPTAFLRRDVVLALGVDESLRYAMDYDLWIRIARTSEIIHVDDYWAAFRRHPAGKTSAEAAGFGPELQRVSRSHGGRRFSDLYFADVRSRHAVLGGCLSKAVHAGRLLRAGDARAVGERLARTLGGVG